MSTPPPETAGVTKPAKDTAESLNAMLWAKADTELKAIIDRHLNLKGLETDVAGVHSGIWMSVLNLTVNGHGTMGKVGAPALILASKEATFLALRDYYRNRYVSNFIHKITSMQQELEDLQQRVG